MADDKTTKVALILTAVDKMSRIVNESVSKSVGYLNNLKKASEKMGGKAGLGSIAASGGAIAAAKTFIDAYSKIEDAQVDLDMTFMDSQGHMKKGFTCHPEPATRSFRCRSSFP